MNKKCKYCGMRVMTQPHIWGCRLDPDYPEYLRRCNKLGEKP